MKHKNLFLLLSLTLVLLYSVINGHAANNSKKEQIKKLLAKRNIIALPSLASQVNTSNFTVSTVDPPALKTIPNSPKDVFWRKIDGINVIDGLINASSQGPFCSEYLYGVENGQSGGLGACHMAESVGVSYSEIVRGGTSLCYMQKLPTKDNFNSGAITINSGSLPSGGIEKLFSVPAGSKSRIVKVNVSGETASVDDPRLLFLEISPEARNKKDKNLYKVDLWFCDSNTNNVTGYNSITVTNGLVFSNVLGGYNRGVGYYTTARGFLTKGRNNLEWNAEKARMSATSFGDPDGARFKSEIEISNKQVIRVKELDNFSSGSIKKSYIATKYTGDSAENIKFLSGAYNQIVTGVPSSGAANYNGIFYETDNQNELLGEVRSVDFNSDFFNSGIEINVDTSQFSCGTIPDIELTMDVNNQKLKNSIGTCVNQELQNMRFCHENADIALADEKFYQICQAG